MGDIVRSILWPGTRLTRTQLKRIKEASRHPIVYDEDCPESTDEDLAEFARFARERDAKLKKQVLSLRVTGETMRIGKSFGRGWTGIMARLLDLAVKDPALLRKAL